MVRHRLPPMIRTVPRLRWDLVVIQAREIVCASALKHDLMFHLQNVDQHLFTFPHGYGQIALGIFDEGFDFRAGLPAEDNRDAENRREREMASRQRYGARQPRGRHIPRRQGARHEGVPTLEGWEHRTSIYHKFILFILHFGFASEMSFEGRVPMGNLFI